LIKKKKKIEKNGFSSFYLVYVGLLSITTTFVLKEIERRRRRKILEEGCGKAKAPSIGSGL
jgi:hypothetical protein